MNNYLKNICISDLLGAELSLFVLSFITGGFAIREEIYLSVIIFAVFLIRYLFANKQNAIIKSVEIVSIIAITVLSYLVDVRLITVVGFYVFLAILLKFVREKWILDTSHVLFSVIAYALMLFTGVKSIALYLFAMSLHLMLVTARELLYESSFEDEEAPEYVDRVKKKFFISRFIIYIFFVYSPMAMALKVVRLFTYMIPLFVLIDLPFIMFISYIRISHSNSNFRKITIFASYSVSLFYLILLTGRF